MPRTQYFQFYVVDRNTLSHPQNTDNASDKGNIYFQRCINRVSLLPSYLYVFTFSRSAPSVHNHAQCTKPQHTSIISSSRPQNSFSIISSHRLAYWYPLNATYYTAPIQTSLAPTLPQLSQPYVLPKVIYEILKPTKTCFALQILQANFLTFPSARTTPLANSIPNI